VPNARLLPELSYEEALELASLGAKMHARSLEVARRFKVNVRIASSANLACEGTRLVEGKQGERMESTVVKGIATKDGFTFFRAGTPLETLLPALRKAKVGIRFLCASDRETRWVCESTKSAALQRELSALSVETNQIPDVAVVSAVGDGFTASCDLVPNFVEALRQAGIEPLLVSVNSVSVSAAVPTSRKAEATRCLHASLIEAPTP